MVEEAPPELTQAMAEPMVRSHLRRKPGGGNSLPGAVRSRMEAAFGVGFDGVDVHAGPAADALATSLSARALTRGNDIFFRRGEFQPATPEGQKLLAHELTHVVQQSGVTAGPAAGGLISPIGRSLGRPVIQLAKGTVANNPGRGRLMIRQDPPPGSLQFRWFLIPPGLLSRLKAGDKVDFKVGSTFNDPTGGTEEATDILVDGVPLVTPTGSGGAPSPVPSSSPSSGSSARFGPPSSSSSARFGPPSSSSSARGVPPSRGSSGPSFSTSQLPAFRASPVSSFSASSGPSQPASSGRRRVYVFPGSGGKVTMGVKRPGAGKFGGLPAAFGGGMESGENVPQALGREVLEETGGRLTLPEKAPLTSVHTSLQEGLEFFSSPDLVPTQEQEKWNTEMARRFVLDLDIMTGDSREEIMAEVLTQAGINANKIDVDRRDAFLKSETLTGIRNLLYTRRLELAETKTTATTEPERATETKTTATTEPELPTETKTTATTEPERATETKTTATPEPERAATKTTATAAPERAATRATQTPARIPGGWLAAVAALMVALVTWWVFYSGVL